MWSTSQGWPRLTLAAEHRFSQEHKVTYLEHLSYYSQQWFLQAYNELVLQPAHHMMLWGHFVCIHLSSLANSRQQSEHSNGLAKQTSSQNMERGEWISPSKASLTSFRLIVSQVSCFSKLRVFISCLLWARHQHFTQPHFKRKKESLSTVWNWDRTSLM